MTTPQRNPSERSSQEGVLFEEWKDDDLVTIRKPSNETGSVASASVVFVGPSKFVSVAGIQLNSALVYVVDGRSSSSVEPSLIESGLAVAPNGCGDSTELTHPPSYRTATPAERRRYLDWLSSGRRDATIPSDYVLLYLQGLERRVLVDECDFAPVATELVKLLWLHGSTRAFRDNISELLSTTIWLGLCRNQIPSSLLHDAIRLVGIESKNWLATVPAILCRTAEVAACEQLTPWPDLIRQHLELFRELFRRRFDLAEVAQFAGGTRELVGELFRRMFCTIYPRGLELKSVATRQSLKYVPINPQLANWMSGYSSPADLHVPDLLRQSKPLPHLADLSVLMVEDLNAQTNGQRQLVDQLAAVSEHGFRLDAEPLHRIAASDGNVTAEERRVLEQIYAELGISGFLPSLLPDSQSLVAPQIQPSTNRDEQTRSAPLLNVDGVSLDHAQILPIKEEQVWIGEPLEAEDVPRVDAGYSLSPPWATDVAGISFDHKQIRRIEEKRAELPEALPGKTPRNNRNYDRQKEQAKLREALQEVQRVGNDNQPSKQMHPDAVTRPELPVDDVPTRSATMISAAADSPLPEAVVDRERRAYFDVVDLSNKLASMKAVVHRAAWDRMIQSHTSSDAWALVPIGKLAAVEGIPRRIEMLESECRQLLEAADNLGFALEPDTRITGQRYQWDELVSVFPRGEKLSGDLSSYRAASALLRLGIMVALADGQVDEAEVAVLFAHLKSQFPLTPHETVRLDHLRYLRTKTRQSDPTVAREVGHKLAYSQRVQVGQFLVGIATVDGNVTTEERRVLGQIYAEFGISDFLSSHLPDSQSLDWRPFHSSTNLDQQTAQAPLAKTGGTSFDRERILPIKTKQTWMDELAEPEDVPHADVGYSLSPPWATDVAGISFDHEQIRRIEEKRAELPEAFSDKTPRNKRKYDRQKEQAKLREALQEVQRVGNDDQPSTQAQREAVTPPKLPPLPDVSVLIKPTPSTSTPARPIRGLKLDMNRVDQIRADTAQVAESSTNPDERTTPVQPPAKSKPAPLDHERIRQIEEEGEKLGESLSEMRENLAAYKSGEDSAHFSDHAPVRIVIRLGVNGEIVGWDVEFVDDAQPTRPTVTLTIRRKMIYWPENLTACELWCVCRVLCGLPPNLGKADRPKGWTLIEPFERRVKGRSAVIGWQVYQDGTNETVLVTELPMPNRSDAYSRVWDILSVARVKRGDMTPYWAESFHRAQAEGVNFCDVESALLKAMVIVNHEWKARRRARKLTGLTSRRMERIENNGHDHTVVPGFAESAAEVMGEFPELKWKSENCCERLWKLLREEDQREPRLFSPVTVDRAMELLKARRPPEVAAPPPVQRRKKTSVGVAKPEPPPKLDMNRVEQIRANTARADEFLCEALRDEDDHLDSVAMVTHRPHEAGGNTTAIPATTPEQATTDATGVASEPDASATFGGLAPRFVPFVERISRQPTWTRGELNRLARELGLMLDGTIDAVNEWTDEQFGDFLLIDKGDVFLIQGELLIDFTGPK